MTFRLCDEVLLGRQDAADGDGRDNADNEQYGDHFDQREGLLVNSFCGEYAHRFSRPYVMRTIRASRLPVNIALRKSEGNQPIRARITAKPSLSISAATRACRSASGVMATI